VDFDYVEKEALHLSELLNGQGKEILST